MALHFATIIQGTAFEIYPLPKSIQSADITTRLGFSIENLDEAIERMKTEGIQIVSEPKQTEWGCNAIVKDPNGRIIELSQI